MIENSNFHPLTFSLDILGKKMWVKKRGEERKKRERYDDKKTRTQGQKAMRRGEDMIGQKRRSYDLMESYTYECVYIYI